MTERAFVAVGVAVLAISDTRTLADDRSGLFIAEKIQAMGHRLADRGIVTDDEDAIRAAVAAYMNDDSVDVVITTGGTGMTYRDVTPEAVAPLGTKHIPGFGELFRHISFLEIGTSTVQSRADAWLCDDTLVFVLPGSTGACRTAMDKILVEQLDVRHRPCNFIEMLPRIKRPKTNQG